MFSIATCLACGSHLTLASAYLGTLYWRLNQCSQDLRHTCGRLEVISMIDMGFLQAFMWEYFPRVAPSYRGTSSIRLRDGSF